MSNKTACGYCGLPVYPSEPHSISDCADFLRIEVVRLQTEIPVWHDAVKDPPKEVDYYIVSRYLKTLGCWAKPIIAEWDGRPEWWVERGYTHWMPLPLPPEKSGE
jgi:hypothetical protein